MSSLNNFQHLVGFFSYSRKDDEHSQGALSRLRGRIHSELRLQLGRDFRLWQDTAAIPEGALWEDEIKRAIAESVFFIPIVTPSAAASPHCRFEFESFLRREASLGRNDLIFPILYITVDALQDERLWRQDDLLKTIATRQYLDWRKFRHHQQNETEIGQKIEIFCRNITTALRQPWLSLEERRRREEAEIKRRAEEEQQRQADEEQAHERAAEERRRRQALAEQRRAEAEQERADDERLRNEERARRRAAAERLPPLWSFEAGPLWPPSRAAFAALSANAAAFAAGIGARLGYVLSPPWRAALAAACLLALVIIGGIGAWLVNVPPKPIAVAPDSGSAAAGLPGRETAPKPGGPGGTSKLAEKLTEKPAETPKECTDCPGTSPAIASNVGVLSPESERALKPKDTFKDCLTCPEMVVVPAGSFVMGSPATELGRSDDEGPQHNVTFVGRFAVGRFTVTFDEWDACAADDGCNKYRPSDKGWGRGRRPVINVSWDDAKAYVAWLSKKTGKTYRLLSEAAFEYVARAGTTTPFWWGNSISTSQANYDGNFIYAGGTKGEYRARTVPVDSFAPNPFGLFQVHGNIWEWTEDCYVNRYATAPTDGSASATGDCGHHVVRGGSWANSPVTLRSANRDGDPSANRSFYRGFRVARALVEP